MKTVKVSEVSHGRLVRVVGMLQAAEGKRKTIKDALVFLLDEHDRKTRYSCFCGFSDVKCVSISYLSRSGILIN